MEKLKRQLAEAEAALETRKKPPLVETGAQVVGDGLVIDEWVNILINSRLLYMHLSMPYLKVCFNSFNLLLSQKERREKYLARQQVEAVGTA